MAGNTLDDQSDYDSIFHKIPSHETPDQETGLRQVLTQAQTIAIVGHSHKPQRPSYQISQFLQQQGYQVYPVNPGLKEINGTPCYPNVNAIPVAIDIVNVFRRSEFLPDIFKDLSTLSTDKLSTSRCLWTQLDIEDQTVAKQARIAGWRVIMNACIKIEYLRLRIQR